MKRRVGRQILVAGMLLSSAMHGVGGERGAEVLRRVRDALPREAMQVNARLVTMDAAGTTGQIYEAELGYAWQDDGYRTEIQIRDRFGAALVRRVEERRLTGEVSVEQYIGPDQTPVTPSALQEPVLSTDFTWSDLALSFLWWPGAEWIGSESLKGRDCHILELTAPGATGEGIAKARLWVDEAVSALLRAEYLDAQGNLVRRFDVKSFAKRDDLFTIQDIDVRSYPSRRRTALRVRDVDIGDRE